MSPRPPDSPPEPTVIIGVGEVTSPPVTAATHTGGRDAADGGSDGGSDGGIDGGMPPPVRAATLALASVNVRLPNTPRRRKAKGEPTLITDGYASEHDRRLCPSCGAWCEGQRCPADGVPTVDVDALSFDACNLRADHAINDRYRVERLLGRGAFGAVYLCEHTTTRQQLAIKLLSIPPDKLDPQHIRRFYQEATVTAALSHPNTIRVFDFGQSDDGPLFLAMEFLRGRSLGQELRALSKRGAQMSVQEALSIGIEILRSLSEAHSQHLVHRDLKPDNIMLVDGHGDTRTVKVLDFGIARTLDSSLTGEGKALGTPGYMSPEQCFGQPLDGRSDLYSLTVMLFHMLTGKLPFVDENPLVVMYGHRNKQPPDIRQLTTDPLPESVVEVVTRGLAKRADDRFQSALEMREALEAALGGAWGHTPVSPPNVRDVDALRLATLEFDAGEPASVAGRSAAATAGASGGALAAGDAANGRSSRWWFVAAAGLVVVGLAVAFGLRPRSEVEPTAAPVAAPEATAAQPPVASPPAASPPAASPPAASPPVVLAVDAGAVEAAAPQHDVTGEAADAQGSDSGGADTAGAVVTKRGVANTPRIRPRSAPGRAKRRRGKRDRVVPTPRRKPPIRVSPAPRTTKPRKPADEGVTANIRVD